MIEIAARHDLPTRAVDWFATVAIAVASIIAICFLVGMGSGASVASSDTLLQSPADGVTSVDDDLRGGASAGVLPTEQPESNGLLTSIVIAVWPLLEAPILAGLGVGLAYPTAAEIAYWLVWIGVAIAAVHQVYTMEGDGDE